LQAKSICVEFAERRDHVIERRDAVGPRRRAKPAFAGVA
jgi:hypothetical protein